MSSSLATSYDTALQQAYQKLLPLLQLVIISISISSSSKHLVVILCCLYSSVQESVFPVSPAVKPAVLLVLECSSCFDLCCSKSSPGSVCPWFSAIESTHAPRQSVTRPWRRHFDVPLQFLLGTELPTQFRQSINQSQLESLIGLTGMKSARYSFFFLRFIFGLFWPLIDSLSEEWDRK